MKRLIILFTLIVFTCSCYGQRNKDYSEMLLHRSGNQKTAGFITLGTGTISTVSGFILVNQTRPGWETVDWDKALGGSALIITGGGFLLSSFILFLASDRNKRQANAIAFSINEPVYINTGLSKVALPYSVGIKVPIR